MRRRLRALAAGGAICALFLGGCSGEEELSSTEQFFRDRDGFVKETLHSWFYNSLSESEQSQICERWMGLLDHGDPQLAAELDQVVLDADGYTSATANALFMKVACETGATPTPPTMLRPRHSVTPNAPCNSARTTRA